MSLSFSLVSPEKIIFDQEVTMVVIPGSEGDIGVLPNHAPLLTLLRPGVICVYQGSDILVKFFANGGFCEIIPERCTALVTAATPLNGLNKAALELEIKNLLEERQDLRTPEEQKNADQNLEIARAKLMEVIAHQN